MDVLFSEKVECEKEKEMERGRDKETDTEAYHKIHSLFCRWNDNKIKCYLAQKC